MELSILECGAVSGGIVSNTKVFKKAIEQVSKEGGKVIVPNGLYLTGPITLLSNVELHLEDNAVILFDKNQEEYPIIATDYEGVDRLRATSPINATNADNIAITGNGTIDGNGHLWRPVKRFKMTDRQWDKLLKKSEYVVPSSEGGVWMPTKTAYDGKEMGELYPTDENAIERATPFYDYYRPVMVDLKHCTNVTLSGVRIQNSPAWAVHLYFCKNVKVLNINVENPYHAQNGDGIDIESCDTVEVSHCNFHVGDDGICLKSGKNAKARQIPGKSQNIHIHHCFVGQSHGGFVIGSEMSRGVTNVVVEDCTFIDADVGVRFKSALGRGGVVDDITIRRINMVNIKEEAFVFTMDYVLNNLDQSVADELNNNESDIPYFRNINISDCNCINVERGIAVKGLKGRPETIRDISFENCVFKAENPDVMVDCENVVVK